MAMLTMCQLLRQLPYIEYLINPPDNCHWFDFTDGITEVQKAQFTFSWLLRE